MSKDWKPLATTPPTNPVGGMRSSTYSRDRRARESYLASSVWTSPPGARADDQPVPANVYGPPAPPMDWRQPLKALGVRAGASGAHRAAISEATSSLAQFIERVPAAVAVVDSDMNELLVSERWNALLAGPAASSDAGVKSDGGSLISAAPERMDRLRLAVDIGVASSFVEKMAGVGGPVWMRWRQSPWRRADGSLAGAFVHVEDITTETLRHSSLLEENDALRSANEELRSLNFAFAQRLDEPLGELENLTRQQESASQQDQPRRQGMTAQHGVTPHNSVLAASCLALMRDRVAVMRDIVQSMVRFGDLSSMQIAGAPEPLAGVIDEAVADLRDVIDRTGALVSVGPTPVVQGDRALLVELFRRLIDNALRHAGDAPTIRIDWLDADTDGLVVRVTDDGPGIAAPVRRRAFEFFERMGDSERQSVGMGLSACRKIMDLHGGVIAADPDWDAGLRIVMTFPFR